MRQGPSESPGGSEWRSPVQCRFRLGCVRRRLNTGTMGTVSPALALKPHNSPSPYVSLVPPELPSLQQSPR